jgi:hypothetical protein
MFCKCVAICSVIPGHAKRVNPESITTIERMDCGSRRCRGSAGMTAEQAEQRRSKRNDTEQSAVGITSLDGDRSKSRTIPAGISLQSAKNIFPKTYPRPLACPHIRAMPIRPRACRERRRAGWESGGLGMRSEGCKDVHPARAAQAVRSRSDSFAARGSWMPVRTAVPAVRIVSGPTAVDRS